jgi:hypothetical protein
MTTITIASGPGWILLRDDSEPAVLEIANPVHEYERAGDWSMLGVQLPEDLTARIAGQSGITGEVIYVGDYRPDPTMIPDGTPCIIIACTREALSAGPPMVYCPVTVARVATPTHDGAEKQHEA